MLFESQDIILLTGAGFTKNFGGFLAKEMWAQIFNSTLLKKDIELKTLLRNDSDFESVYSKVLTGNFSSSQKDLIKKATEAAYKNLDDTLTKWTFNPSNATDFNIYNFQDLLTLFMGNSNKKGFFFTLNQDILMERRNLYRSLGTPHLGQRNGSFLATPYDRSNFITLPTDIIKVKQEIIANDFHYVKLHGSYGWQSSDGLSQMVIGKNKSELIDREPILGFYFSLFQDVIAQGNKKLLIIGYGFCDQHINEALLKGVREHSLKLHIINTMSLHDLRVQMSNGHHYALPLLDGIDAYYPFTFREIFPPDQSLTNHFSQIKEGLSLE